MKIITVGDPHFRKNNVLESKEMVEKLLITVQKEQPKFVVVLGDVLHRHETINVFPLNRAEEMIIKLSQIAPTFVLIGNHDRPNNSNYLTDEHPFNALKHWKDTYIVDKVMDLVVEGKKFVFVPYVPPGKFMDALNTIENPLKDTDIIFAHQEFYGAKMGAIVSKAGDPWSLDNPLVVSGHVHDFDNLQPNIIYTGTPMQHSFGDKADKTISMFTVDGDIKHERIDLQLRKKITHYVTPEELHTYIPPDNVSVKLKVRGDEGAIKAAVKLEKVQELKRQNVLVVFETIRNTNNSDTKVLTQIKYKDRLFKEICEDKYCVKWFNKIFV